jgi:hypothetical protein
VLLAAQLILEEALEGEVRDEIGRDRYERHVHVHSGGQAIVGAVETSGGVGSENQGHADAKGITHAPVAPLWGKDQEREPVPRAGDAEREVPPSRRGVARSA